MTLFRSGNTVGQHHGENVVALHPAAAVILDHPHHNSHHGAFQFPQLKKPLLHQQAITGAGALPSPTMKKQQQLQQQQQTAAAAVLAKTGKKATAPIDNGGKRSQISVTPLSHPADADTNIVPLPSVYSHGGGGSSGQLQPPEMKTDDIRRTSSMPSISTVSKLNSIKTRLFGNKSNQLKLPPGYFGDDDETSSTRCGSTGEICNSRTIRTTEEISSIKSAIRTYGMHRVRAGTREMQIALHRRKVDQQPINKKCVRFAEDGENVMKIKLLRYEQIEVPEHFAPWNAKEKQFTFFGRKPKNSSIENLGRVCDLIVQEHQEEEDGNESDSSNTTTATKNSLPYSNGPDQEGITWISRPLPSLAEDPDDLTADDLKREFVVAATPALIGGSSSSSRKRQQTPKRNRSAATNARCVRSGSSNRSPSSTSARPRSNYMTAQGFIAHKML